MAEYSVAFLVDRNITKLKQFAAHGLRVFLEVRKPHQIIVNFGEVSREHLLRFVDSESAIEAALLRFLLDRKITRLARISLSPELVNRSVQDLEAVQSCSRHCLIDSFPRTLPLFGLNVFDVADAILHAVHLGHVSIVQLEKPRLPLADAVALWLASLEVLAFLQTHCAQDVIDPPNLDFMQPPLQPLACLEFIGLVMLR